MFILSRYIDAYEHSSSSVTAINKSKTIPSPHPKRLRVGLVRLAVAVAKTMHSNPIGKAEFFFAVQEQISALQRHTASHSTNPRNLRLKESYFYRNLGLRDFSKSTIEGQYAQAINFLFFQDILGIPALLDFDWYCRDKIIPQLDQGISRPDFVACERNGYWLIESKANLESNSVKTKLREGLLQCASGQTHLMANGHAAPVRSYSSLVSFRLSNSNEDTVIHYADPEHAPNQREFDALGFLRTYYEIALKAIGYPENPKEIWESDNALLLQNSSEYLGRQFYDVSSDDSGGVLFSELQRDRVPEFYYAGIDIGIIAALRDGDLQLYFSLVSQLKERTAELNRDQYANEPDWPEESELFVDGTYIEAIW
jgi:hypothetical protein